MNTITKALLIVLATGTLLFSADGKSKTKSELEKEFPTTMEGIGISDSSTEKEPKVNNTAAEPAVNKGAADTSGAIYVGGYSVDHEWDIVTEECLKRIASKKILYGSRSWGLVIGSYVQKVKPIKWEGNVRVTAKDKILTADSFSEPKILNFIMDPVPNRWMYFNEFLRNDPWKFGSKIDGGLQTLYYTGDKEDMADSYFPVLDALVKDFPNVKFAVATHNIGADGTDLNGKEVKEASEWNIRGGDFSDRVVKTYYGKLPIFDVRDIVSTRADGTVCSFEHNGKIYRKLCPEYNKNKDMIHPNTEEAQARLGKGFLILLTKMYCQDLISKPLNTPRPEILDSK